MRTEHSLSWIRWIVLLILWSIAGACSNNDNGTEPGDTTAPAAVTNLAAGNATTSSLVLTWSAPGDDGSAGTAAQYDLRYSTATITAENFADAAPANGEPTPGGAGSAQTMTISGLAADTLYFFAVKTADEVPNWSGRSNVATGRTLAVEVEDTTPPGSVLDLAVADATTTSLLLTWTAPGDDGPTGTATTYDLRYSLAEITAENFTVAFQVAGEPAPLPAGSAQSMTVAGLSEDTPYYFALKTADEADNWGEMSNSAQGRTLPEIIEDTTAPAEITDLAVGAVTPTSVTLTWTATGDDGTFGTASVYDLRSSTSLITEGNFADATELSDEPVPTPAGTQQSMTITGLAADTRYSFALKVADEVPNWSAISNVVQLSTVPPPDGTPPAAITDLRADALDATSVQIEWTAPGDDGSTGQAAEYDLRYSSSEITDGTWEAAIPIDGEPAPATAGTPQSMTVEGLESDTDFYFAIKTDDEVPNGSALSNPAFAHTPSAPAPPPPLAAPDFPDTVCIDSDDPYARAAQEIARGQLARITAYTSMASAFFGPLANVVWQSQGGCWEYPFQPFGCNWLYRACLDGLGYEYTLTWDGACGGQEYDQWVADRCRVNDVARTGSFYIYARNSTDVAAAWIWTWAADENSGTYTFYSGDPGTTPIQGDLVWSRSPDHITYDLTYVVPEEAKFESHFVKDPCSGWVRTYGWSPTQTWWLENQIEWKPDGSGSWDQYDETGALMEEHVW